MTREKHRKTKSESKSKGSILSGAQKNEDDKDKNLYYMTKNNLYMLVKKICLYSFTAVLCYVRIIKG